MAELRSKVKQLPDVRSRSEGEGRVLLYNPRSDGLHILGPTESYIFSLCDGRSISALISAARPVVTEDHAMEQNEVPGQVIHFLSQLKTRGLIEIL